MVVWGIKRGIFDLAGIVGSNTTVPMQLGAHNWHPGLGIQRWPQYSGGEPTVHVHQLHCFRGRRIVALPLHVAHQGSLAVRPYPHDDCQVIFSDAPLVHRASTTCHCSDESAQGWIPGGKAPLTVLVGHCIRHDRHLY